MSYLKLANMFSVCVCEVHKHRLLTYSLMKFQNFYLPGSILIRENLEKINKSAKEETKVTYNTAPKRATIELYVPSMFSHRRIPKPAILKQ